MSLKTTTRWRSTTHLWSQGPLGVHVCWGRDRWLTSEIPSDWALGWVWMCSLWGWGDNSEAAWLLSPAYLSAKQLTIACSETLGLSEPQYHPENCDST